MSSTRGSTGRERRRVYAGSERFVCDSDGGRSIAAASIRKVLARRSRGARGSVCARLSRVFRKLLQGFYFQQGFASSSRCSRGFYGTFARLSQGLRSYFAMLSPGV